MVDPRERILEDVDGLRRDVEQVLKTVKLTEEQREGLHTDIRRLESSGARLMESLSSSEPRTPERIESDLWDFYVYGVARLEVASNIYIGPLLQEHFRKARSRPATLAAKKSKAARRSKREDAVREAAARHKVPLKAGDKALDNPLLLDELNKVFSERNLAKKPLKPPPSAPS